jgi:hypothetical protein
MLIAFFIGEPFFKIFCYKNILNILFFCYNIDIIINIQKACEN